MLFLEYPKCSTCKKAKKWLDEQGISYEDRHIIEDNPTAEELKDCTSGQYKVLDQSQQTGQCSNRIPVKEWNIQTDQSIPGILWRCQYTSRYILYTSQVPLADTNGTKLWAVLYKSPWRSLIPFCVVL